MKQTVPLAQLGISLQQIDGNALSVAQRIIAKGYKACLVGGAVRDLLLGLKPKDYDVVTNATPERIKPLFRRARIIGRRFRLVHVPVDRHQVIEVSTFRARPRHGQRHGPGMVREDNTYGTMEEDAHRRDLTINALMLDPVAQVVHDYHGGLRDLQARCLRIIGKPEVRYQEDPVRMMRVLRLAAKLDCRIDAATLAPLPHLAYALGQVAPARLFDEFVKLITARGSLNGLRLYRDNGILAYLFPQTAAYAPAQFRFVETAFRNTELLLEDGEFLSLSYVIAALFWPEIAAAWQELKDNDQDKRHEMSRLARDSELWRNHLLPRNMRVRIQLLWELQAVFQRQRGMGRAVAMKFNQQAFKALMFLRLRQTCGEVPGELVDWWERFLPADNATRQTMVVVRQRRKRAAAAPPAPDLADATGPGD